MEGKYPKLSHRGLYEGMPEAKQKMFEGKELVQIDKHSCWPPPDGGTAKIEQIWKNFVHVKSSKIEL